MSVVSVRLPVIHNTFFGALTGPFGAWLRPFRAAARLFGACRLFYAQP